MSTDPPVSQKHVVVATVDFEDKWWIIRFPDLETVTQARHVGEIETMARDAAAIWLDCEPDTINLNLTTRTIDHAVNSWKHAQHISARAQEDEREAAKLRRQTVRDLRRRGITFADIAAILHISIARVHQLAR